MSSFFSKLFGGSDQGASDSQTPKRGEPVAHGGFVVHAAPEVEGKQWRLAGLIIKQGEEGNLERTFVRADVFASWDEAESFAVRKGRQIIDEQGDRLFADGEKTGRA